MSVINDIKKYSGAGGTDSSYSNINTVTTADIAETY